MSFLLRLSLGLILLIPSLVHAAVLENPGTGLPYSGVGVISGWKCEAEGALTIVFNEDGKHIPLLYGSERTDVRNAGACRDVNVGFVALWNWAELGEGSHTAVAYDNGKEFARSTFTVATLGEAFVVGTSGECTIENFPQPGESATFAWNQATQHLELVPEEIPSGFAPADQAAFDRMAVGKRIVSVDDARYYTDFPSAGRFVEYEPGERHPGRYRYSKTGPNTGTLTQNYDGGDVCTSQFTFTSPTSGSARYTCDDGDTGGGNWRLIDSPSGFAPADQAAFDAWVVGKRAVSVDDARYYTDFPSAGRFVEYEPGERWPGRYRYRRTGPNTGTLTQNYDDGDVCTSQFTLTSPTSGSSRYTCDDGEQGGGNWRLVDSPSGGGGPVNDGQCRAGLVVNPGESCTHPTNGGTFSVDSSGRGSFTVGGFTNRSSDSIQMRNATINGQTITFVARRNSGSNSWTIDEVG